MADSRRGKPSMEGALDRAGKQPARRRQVDMEKAEAFIAGAGRSGVVETPIEGLDPAATPRIRFIMMFNDYEMAALDRRKERTGLSKQKILRSMVVPLLHEGEKGQD